MVKVGQANGMRYPRVGGMRQRHFAGTNFKPRNLLENAQTPTRRVHAGLACRFYLAYYLFNSQLDLFVVNLRPCFKHRQVL